MMKKRKNDWLGSIIIGFICSMLLLFFILVVTFSYYGGTVGFISQILLCVFIFLIITAIFSAVAHLVRQG